MSDFKERILAAKFNPSLMHLTALNELESQVTGLGNYDVPDPSNPFVWLMEMSTLAVSAGMSENEAALNRVYARLATTESELYLHMSDRDHIDRFAIPAVTTYNLLLSRDEIIQKAVPVPDTQIRRLTIPRMTEFTVADTTFTMQYPIHIQRMSHGGLQITYGTDDISPIQTLPSNMVDWDVIRIGQEELVVLRLPVNQMKITTHTETLNVSSGFGSDYGFTDQFFIARVYLSNGNGGWTEMRTTHTDQVYDPLVPTAVLKVTDNNLNITIPDVYFTQRLIQGEIRIDVYTTKGPVDIDLGSYETDQFSHRFNSIDDDRRYTSPLASFSRIQSLNPNRVEGGRNAMSFEELRDQVIENTLGSTQLPITKAQLNSVMQRRGYRVVADIDNITDRQFIATRTLPRPNSRNTSASMGCLMGQLQRTFEQLSASDHVIEHDERVTILPSQLYEYRDGQVLMVANNTINELIGLTPEGIASRINQARYLYSPFHYVLDGRDDRFDVRPYYIDNPTIDQKVFVGENDSAEMQMSVENYGIERNDSGLVITVSLRGSERVNELDPNTILVQLSYLPVGERTYASTMGERIIDSENPTRLIYQFTVETDYDFDRDHQLHTTNFTMFDENQRDFYIPLSAELDVTFIVTDQDMRQYVRGELDQLVSEHLIDADDYMVVSRERLQVTLGYSLTNIWQRGRSLLSEASYQSYEADVPYVYEKTIFKRDQDGQLILGLDSENNVTYDVEHQKGDPVLDDNGEPVMRFLKGDTKYDGNGQPILISPRKLLREFTLFLMDGLYYFVTDPVARSYRDAVPDYITNWLRNDIDILTSQLLERTELYLQPTTTFGDTPVIVGQGRRTTVSLTQSINVEYYLTETAYLNPKLREAMSKRTREVVSDLLERDTITITDITTRLREEGGDDIIDVKVTGLGGVENYSVVSVTDDATRLALGKRAVALPNELISVQDDIDIGYLRHNRNQ